MKHVISWYFIPYVSAVVIALTAFIVTINATDGIIPICAGLILLGVIFFTIPCMVYMDYRTLKDFVLKGAEAYHEPGKRIEFYQEMTTKAASQFGCPEIVAQYTIHRIVKKFNLANDEVVPNTESNIG